MEEAGAIAGTVLSDAQRLSVPAPGQPIRRIGILGGGTAGYLTALACQSSAPTSAITLIEDPAVPIIGVGEATTPLLCSFLDDTARLDRVELYRQVKPTWKIGIKFIWGQPGDYYYNYPFGRSLLKESAHYSGHLNDASIQSVFMDHALAPVFRSGNGRYQSLVDSFLVAYHLDNERFVSYLRRVALARGIVHLERRIERVFCDAESDGISGLITDRGEEIDFDIYVDCTGFRSLLMGKSLSSDFRSFASSLFTDGAIVGQVPHDGPIRPFTTAETMSCGWCWNIPLHDRESVGYVFASSFCSPDAAEAEVRRRYPAITSTRLVPFRVGRHSDFWRGNVVAVGNAYGFVEPLESTGIHMICRAAELVAAQLGHGQPDQLQRDLLSRRIANQWDYLRWFLAIHYRFNRRIKSPFWEACGADADVSGMAPLIDSFSAHGPLYDRVSRSMLRECILGDDPGFGVRGVDTHLMGQQVRGPDPRPGIDRATWEQWLGRIHRARRSALQQAEALAVLERHPELL